MRFDDVRFLSVVLLLGGFATREPPKAPDADAPAVAARAHVHGTPCDRDEPRSSTAAAGWRARC